MLQILSHATFQKEKSGENTGRYESTCMCASVCVTLLPSKVGRWRKKDKIKSGSTKKTDF